LVDAFAFSLAYIKEYEIGSGQWISDFQKSLGIGKFLITPISPNTLKDIPEQQLTEDEIKFRKRLVKAYQTLSEMERLLRIGEWGSVVKQSRELLELFEKDETRFIKEEIFHRNNKN
jgi:vacuolar-type H+-ATPase subunit B/Vma2